MKSIQRNTEVVSVSLPKSLAQKLDQIRVIKGQSRSAFIASLIQQQTEDDRWQRLYKKGEKTARKLKITSEDAIDRILHGA